MSESKQNIETAKEFREKASIVTDKSLKESLLKKAKQLEKGKTINK